MWVNTLGIGDGLIVLDTLLKPGDACIMNRRERS